ncbi:MAG: zinc-binding alcohol dehydrogenase family protein [Pseudomonadota bacterium]
MRAIGYRQPGSPEVLEEFELPEPTPGPRDLLVSVHAVSVNPVDTKIRAARPAAFERHVLGYDAAGIVEAVGAEVVNFSVGDRVFYAGDITRQGTNCERHLVDERIVGPMPTALSFEEAAALPLTVITAWELLFDSLGVSSAGESEGVLLITGAAGGVGSALVQIARALTHMTVVGTASRPETKDWAKSMGAHHVIDHHASIVAQLKDLSLVPSFVASLTASDQHMPSIVDVIAPRGRIALIDDPKAIDILSMKPKSLALCWEFMFARPMFDTHDMASQHQLLSTVSQLVDSGAVKSTATQFAGALTVEGLQMAHLQQETGRVIGKTVFKGLGANN